MLFKQLLSFVFLVLVLSGCEELSSPTDTTNNVYGSWEMVREPQNEELYNSIYFTDETNGWAVGDSGIVIYTSDGGNRWIYQHSGTESSLKNIQFIDQNNGWIVGSDNTILKTENGGNDWIVKKLPSDLSKTFLSLFFINERKGWIVDNYGGIFCTSDSGNSWILQESNTHWAITSVQFLTENQGWAIATNKLALKTDNGGTNWHYVKIPSISDAIAIVCNDIFFINEDKGWISGAYAGSTMQESVPLYHTKDAGLTWETQTNLPSWWVNSIFFIDNNSGWIVGAGKILSTQNSGNSWIIQHEDENEIFEDVSFVNSIHGWVLGYRGSIYKYVLNKK